jgi:hypothetical protein
MFVNGEGDGFNRPTAIDYLWTIGHTKDGDTIIAHQIRTRRGHQEGVMCIVEIRGEIQYQWKNKSEVNYEELKYYLNLEGIKKIGKKDEKGNKKKIWSWEDKKDFKELLWVIVGTLETLMVGVGKGRRDPTTLCCANFGQNIDLLFRSDYSNVIGKKVSNATIESYYRKANITLPWEVQSNTVRMSQKDFENMGGTSSTAESILKLGGNSLQNSLSKLAERVNFMEEKVSKIDDVVASTQKLVKTVADLTAMVAELKGK